MLTWIWGSVTPRSYAHFWSFYSWGHVLHYGLDHISLSLLWAVFLLRSWSHRQYRDRTQTKGFAAAMILGCFALDRIDRAVPYHASVVSGYSLPVCINQPMPYQAALLLQAILHSCMLCAWSRDLGVSFDPKSCLGNTPETCTKIHRETNCSRCSIGLECESQMNLLPVQWFFNTPL